MGELLESWGICIIEHSSLHELEGATEFDPFGADFMIMPYLITTWGKGRYGVRQLLTSPIIGDNISRLHFIVVQRFRSSEL